VLLTLPGPQLHQDTSANEGSDIYRGRTPSPTRPLSPDEEVSSRSSLSDSTAGRGRLGALAAVVDRAITRWARRNTSDSSSSSSESSESSAVTRSRVRLRKRRPSIGTLHTVQSERNIAARIKWIQAREEQRQIPREFTLYLPPSFAAGRPPHERMMRRITRTTSLSLILAQLDSTLKTNHKPRRAQEQNRGFKGRAHGASHNHAVVYGTTSFVCLLLQNRQNTSRKVQRWLAARRSGKTSGHRFGSS
jgi:magnesium transporter